MYEFFFKLSMAQTYQQNLGHLDSPDRAGQRDIESQRLQDGAVLYSAVQFPIASVQLWAECSEMEICTIIIFTISVSQVIQLCHNNSM